MYDLKTGIVRFGWLVLVFALSGEYKKPGGGLEFQQPLFPVSSYSIHGRLLAK